MIDECSQNVSILELWSQKRKEYYSKNKEKILEQQRNNYKKRQEKNKSTSHNVTQGESK